MAHITNRILVVIAIMMLLLAGCKSETQEVQPYTGNYYETEYIFSGNISAKGKIKESPDFSDSSKANMTAHVELACGEVMDISWNGPKQLGARVASTDDSIIFCDENREYIYMLTGASLKYNTTLYADAVLYDSAKWYEYTDEPYVEDGYYKSHFDIDVYEVVFAVDYGTHKGYCRYIIDTDKFVFNKFVYVEKVEEYNDDRAIKVINSISP